MSESGGRGDRVGGDRGGRDGQVGGDPFEGSRYGGPILKRIPKGARVLAEGVLGRVLKAITDSPKDTGQWRWLF